MQQTQEPKAFAILIPEAADTSTKNNRLTLNNLKSVPGSWKIKGLERLINCEFRIVSEDDEVRHFNMAVTYKQRSVIAQEISEVKGSFDVWHHRGGFAIALDCSRFMVDSIAAFLSLSIYGEIGIFRGQTLRKEGFLKIQQHAFNLGGVLSVLHLRTLKVQDSEMSVYNLSGKNIGNPSEQISAAKKIKRMGFRFPRLGDSPFHFWVADWGGGTIYQPLVILPHHALALAKFFEDALRD